MTTRITLTITLLDDVVISESGATAEHRSLSWIPGSAISGALISQLHRSNQLDQTFWRAWTSGTIRCHNGYPASAGQRSLPAPKSWHHAKGAVYVKKGALVEGEIHNLLSATLGDDQQPKQVRSGFVDAHGGFHSVTHVQSLKTAISHDTGRAAEGQLFGYSALKAGQAFIAYVDVDDPALATRVTEQLSTTSLRIGRSRSAQFGRTRLSVTSATAPVHTATTSSTSSATDYTVWCLSDLCLLDQQGQPTLAPKPQDVGLPAGELVPGLSFMRVRRYSPWNAYRGSWDSERQVIQMGSVFTWRFPAPLSPDALTGLEKGIGRFREQGLGAVLVSAAGSRMAPPEWSCEGVDILGNKQPVFKTGATSASSQDDARRRKVQTSELPVNQRTLAEWLEKKTSAKSRKVSHETAREVSARLERLYASARAFEATTGWVGPTPSQWGQILQAAQDTRDPATLYKKIFDLSTGICRSNDPDWSCIVQEGNVAVTFAAWLNGAISQGGQVERDFCMFLSAQAREIAQRLQKQIPNKGVV